MEEEQFNKHMKLQRQRGFDDAIREFKGIGTIAIQYNLNKSFFGTFFLNIFFMTAPCFPINLF